MDERVNLAEKLALVEKRWSPKIIGTMNDYKLQVVKVQGEFVWHRHEETDDFFLVTEGRLAIDLREDGRERTVELAPGELFVVPRGVEHRPRADQETHLLLIEPAGTPNTGDAGGPLSAVEETL